MTTNSTESQIYKHVTSYYQALLDNGASPEVAKELTVQQVAEGGYNPKWWTGDKVKFNTPEELAKHVLDHHKRMYPDSLKAKNFEDFYNGIQRTGQYMYNSEKGYLGYKLHLLSYRPAILRRLAKYEQSRAQNNKPKIVLPKPLPYLSDLSNKNDATLVSRPLLDIPAKKLGGRLKRHLNVKK